MNGTGLVLAGGGGKGIYQVGMLKSLAEAGLLDDIVAVSGTSIGSVNAVLFSEGIAEYNRKQQTETVQTPEIKESSRNSAIKYAIDQMEKAWDEIDFGVFFNTDVTSLKAGDSHFSRNATSSLIDKYLDYSLFKDDMVIPTYVTCAGCPEGIVTYEQITNEELKLLTSASTEQTYADYTTQYMLLNDKTPDYIKSAILATTALPVIYSPVNVDGRLYIDGGVKDNVPVKPLHDIGIRRFIVIELSNESCITNIQNYSDSEIIDILPSHDLGSLLSGTMNFDREDIAVKKEIGVRDGRRYIKTHFEKDEIYIKLERELAIRDYESIIQQRDFDRKYNSLSSDVNSRFDYINNLEKSLKKYDL